MQAEDQANTQVAIEAAKSMFNAHPEITGMLGLDSSSGTGIGRAIEELGLQKKKMTIVVHDREDVTLEYIDKGIIAATVEAKTAIAPYLAVLMMEDYNSRKKANDVPISVNNWDSKVVRSFPQFVYVGSVIIDKSNVKNFLRSAMPKASEAVSWRGIRAARVNPPGRSFLCNGRVRWLSDRSCNEDISKSYGPVQGAEGR